MDKVMCKMTVFFEQPFWVGVFERIDNEKLSVCKVTFGAEPKDYEVYDFISREYYHLKFSPAVATVEKQRFGCIPAFGRTGSRGSGAGR